MSNKKDMGTDADPVDKDVKLNKRDSVALKKLLVKRLTECGWRKNIEEIIRKTILDRGQANLTCDQLVQEVVPKARAMVPVNVRKEMLMRVRAALESSLPKETEEDV